MVNKIDRRLHICLSKQSDNMPSGRIHSVYDRVINILLCDGEEMFSIASPEIIQSPMMLRTNEKVSFKELDDYIFQGMDVFKSGDYAIRIKNLVFDYKNAEIYTGKIPVVNFNDKHPPKSHIRDLTQFLLQSGKNSGLLDAWSIFLNKKDNLGKDNLYAESFIKILFKLNDSIIEDNKEDFVDCIYRLSGFGIGLTPSGDDFILGFLSAFRSWGIDFGELLQGEWLIKLKGLSTTVSYFMLKNCMEGYVNEALLKLLECGHENLDAKPVLNEVIKIGSTSGTDMLIGVDFDYRHISEVN